MGGAQTIAAALGAHKPRGIVGAVFPPVTGGLYNRSSMTLSRDS